MKQSELTAEIEAQAEQSYDQLDGKWRDWLEVARQFEHKASPQDRLDLRHTIIVAFADQQARNERLGKPDLSFYGMLRIASHCVADYWRQVNKAQVRVCIYNGLAKEPHCASCSHKTEASQCLYLALRPIQSLDSEATDSEGNTVRLIDTLADDHAIDLDLWLDASTFKLGCPDRLVQLAVKRHKGIPLNQIDQRYFTRQRQKELKRYQKTLF